MSGGGKGKKTYTVGYWYGLGMHMALCHGPVDEVTEVIVGEKTAWTGSVTSNGSLVISRRDLFGGEEREGGVDGTLDVMMGGADQAPNAYLQSKLGANIPAFRGVLSVAWRGRVSAMNPYIKPWRFRVKRIPRAWHPAYAEINADANPAHIIRECLTNSTWGMGYPDADIDDASFMAAANTLYAEGFGLSILWDQEQPIEDFILSILRHIDGVLYVHPRTGKFTLRLARNDYNAASLPTLSPSNVLRIEEFTRPSWGEIVNQVTIQYRDGQTDKDASITVQDIAAIQPQGGVVATTVRYPGISNGTLANRVAMRELKQLSSTLAKVTLVANSDGIKSRHRQRLQTHLAAVWHYGNCHARSAYQLWRSDKLPCAHRGGAGHLRPARCHLCQPAADRLARTDQPTRALPGANGLRGALLADRQGRGG